MSKPNSFPLIRAKVLRLVALIPKGKFTTYGSIARHMNVNPRHVAKSLSGLSPEESKKLPWHRVVAAEGRISKSMAPEHAERQRKLLEKEKMKVDPRGLILDQDTHFHAVGLRREIRWDQE
ncbi:MGMT family protein [Haloferula sp. BvORR071]|uniref:MGMT family protein n=1 Tax=Haloferula sp. BvORR071 TaxID=1396141 RepID=UPI0005599164|nr:MGMT family protein [Haloferula sp. BvORR071]